MTAGERVRWFGFAVLGSATIGAMYLGVEAILGWRAGVLVALGVAGFCILVAGQAMVDDEIGADSIDGGSE